MSIDHNIQLDSHLTEILAALRETITNWIIESFVQNQWMSITNAMDIRWFYAKPTYVHC